MSSSRAERRRQERGGAQPPKKRDPMVPIYIGFAVIVVLIFAGFGIANYIANHKVQQVASLEMSTPSPQPSPTLKPIKLVAGQTIGTLMQMRKPNIEKNILSDTQIGGQGQPIDGIPCESSEEAVLHIHTELSIFVNGKQAQVPPYIGFAGSPTGGCLYWLHTHDATGVIHIEAGAITSPQNGGPYTLGMFFDVWGQPLNFSEVGPYKGPVTIFVNRQPYSGDPTTIPLRAHELVTLEVGKPVVPPPNYILPEGD